MALFAKRTARMTASEARVLLKVIGHPEMISFGGGLPSPDSFPVSDIAAICKKVLEKHGPQALQYGTTEGYEGLRVSLARRMQKYGIGCDARDLMITTGSQQVLDLIGKIFLDPGDVAVVESPTYFGAFGAWNAYEPQYATIPMDDKGMVTGRLDALLTTLEREGKTVKFVYCIPNGHNPAGTTMPLARRKQLLRVAEKHKVLVVEDDPYAELFYEDHRIPPVKSFDRTGTVIYTSTFSKVLAPGFRLGWVIAAPHILQKLNIAKQGADLCSNTFAQYVAREYMDSGMMDRQIPKIRAMYKRKRDIMLAALEEHFPPGCTWTRPKGGLFLWVMLPKRINTTEMLHDAINAKVAYVRGEACCVDATCKNAMRLNFSNTADDLIEEGIKRLAKLIRARMRA